MLVSIGSLLLTEGVLKKIIVLGLDRLASKTKSDLDDRLLKIIREAWNIKE